jgi:TonB-dependent SusC/RagA subfamily outer membrane receptor
VTGSISSLNEEKLGGDRPIKMEEFLRGRVAGLELVKTVNGRSKLRIRGTNSLLSQQEPLIVVDGVPMSTSDLELALAGLTYKDIRQVDVLKDVSSTAIYGLRGAGGVIVINTWR